MKRHSSAKRFNLKRPTWGEESIARRVSSRRRKRQRLQTGQEGTRKTLETIENMIGLTSSSFDQTVLVLGPSEVLYPFTLRKSYIVLNAAKYSTQLNAEMIICAIQGKLIHTDRKSIPMKIKFPETTSMDSYEPESKVVAEWIAYAREFTTKSNPRNGCKRVRFQDPEYNFFHQNRWNMYYGGEFTAHPKKRWPKKSALRKLNRVEKKREWTCVAIFIYDARDPLESELMKNRVCYIEHKLLRAIAKENMDTIQINECGQILDFNVLLISIKISSRGGQ